MEEESEDVVSNENLTTGDNPSREPIRRLSGRFCAELGLSQNASDVTWHMAINVNILVGSEEESLELTVATTLYMITHIINEHRSLEEISRISGIQADRIDRHYRWIHQHREVLVYPSSFRLKLQALSGAVVPDVVGSLPPPNADEGEFDLEESGGDLERYAIQPKGIYELCDQYSDELGLSERISDVFYHISAKIKAGFYPAAHSPLPVVAVSLYMLSHVATLGISVEQISETVGISEGAIRNAYRRVFPRRNLVIDHYVFYHMIRIHRAANNLA